MRIPLALSLALVTAAQAAVPLPTPVQSMTHPNARTAQHVDRLRAVATDADGGAAVLVPRTGTPRTVRLPRSSRLYSSLVTPGGRTLAVQVDYATCQVKVAVWNLTSGKVIAPLRGHFARALGCDRADGTDELFGTHFTPDGGFLITHSAAGLRRWDARGGQPLQALPGTFFNVSISPDGRSVAALAQNRRVEVWTSDLTRRLKVLPQQPADCFRASGMFPSGVAWSADSTRLAFSCDREVRVWNVQAGGLRGLQREQKVDAPDAPTFSPDGRFVVADEDAAGVAVWNVASGQRVAQLKTPGPSVQVTDVEVTPGNMLFAALDDGRILRANLNQPAQVLEPLRPFPGGARLWPTLAVSREGDRLAVASGDGRLNVYALPGN
ncbi:WD40 repeat domain-containing protein [Deinococcus sp. MIMF12]|uniref:WD40 repeat domain-containing protein n=1 Tax=Deinococcus rhizophilus TaxID=3049544 RepID=A0ABT7JGW5_9DEIO|nr:WD40 repeat domain-containing protein [Deinococcus rhizophilus]MDL2344287.1 WD40 repeat domain-containing protein [Deinococcus rhizophilus]